jgi:hypothetical protein
MLDRSKLGGEEPRPQSTNGNGNGAVPAPPTVPEPRLMATGLPQWDLEPPSVLIRRGPR